MGNTHGVQHTELLNGLIARGSILAMSLQAGRDLVTSRPPHTGTVRCALIIGHSNHP